MDAPTLFRTIYADPPWPERGGGKSKRGADRHYPLMTVKQIRALPVQSLANPTGCHLWLWATGNYLGDAVDCMRSWGFRLVNCRPWVKAERALVAFLPGTIQYDKRNGDKLEHLPEDIAVVPQAPGLGQYLRCDAEFLLFGVMGGTMMPSFKPSQTLYEPRGRHSAKPQRARQQIELMSPAPRVELFAREPSIGWERWGNEVECTVDLSAARTNDGR